METTLLTGLILVAGGLLAALGIFLMLAAFFKKGCGWLLWGVIALILSALLGIGRPPYYALAMFIGLILGCFLLAIVRFLETK